MVMTLSIGSQIMAIKSEALHVFEQDVQLGF